MEADVTPIDWEMLRREGPHSYAENYALVEDFGYTVYQGVTSPRHQAGKSAFVLMAMHTVEEQVHGSHADLDNFAFSNTQLMERYEIVPQHKLLGEDEPQRSTNASNRKWSSQGNQDLVEFLMQEAHSHNGVLFATPHNGFVDNHLVDIWTSLVVVGQDHKGMARLYGMDRYMLERQIKNDTPFIAQWDYRNPEKAIPDLWREYLKRKIAENAKRAVTLIENSRRADKDLTAGRGMDKVQAYELVRKDPAKYKDDKGKVTGSSIEVKIPNISASAASYAAKRINDDIRLENAERQA